MKKDNEKEKLVPIIVRLSKEKKEMLEKLASKQGRFESDIIRSEIEKKLNIQMYKDNLDFIVKQLDSIVDAKLSPFIKSQRKLTGKYLRTSAINTYLLGEFFDKILGDDMHKNFIKM